MSLVTNLFAEAHAIRHAFGGAAPSSATALPCNMKGYQKATALIIQNKGSSAAGCAVALQQDQAIGMSSPVVLPFSTAWRGLDVNGTPDVAVLTQFDVSSNTFTTDDTDSVVDVYAIDIPQLTTDYDWFRLTLGNAANNVVTAFYLLSAPRYAGQIIDPAKA